MTRAIISLPLQTSSIYTHGHTIETTCNKLWRRGMERSRIFYSGVSVGWSRWAECLVGRVGQGNASVHMALMEIKYFSKHHLYWPGEVRGNGCGLGCHCLGSTCKAYTWNKFFINLSYKAPYWFIPPFVVCDGQWKDNTNKYKDKLCYINPLLTNFKKSHFLCVFPPFILGLTLNETQT